MFCCKNKTSAKVVDGSLILNLASATTPTVWHLDLAEVKSAALEVASETEGVHTLVLKKGNKATVEIANFDDRAKAVQALMVSAKALQKGAGHLRAVGTVAGEGAALPKKKGGNGLIIFLLSLVVLLALAWLLMGPGRAAYLKYQLEKQFAAPVSQAGRPSAQQYAPPAALPEPQGPYGVPQAAEEYLRQRGVN